MLKTAPEDQLLASLEELLRAGLPPALPGTAWAGQSCPAGHWLMPQGSRLYRYDVPAAVHTPCAILYFDKDSEAYAPGVPHGGDEIWWLHAAVDLLWDRDLTTLETQQIGQSLLRVFTSDLAGTVPAQQQLATARLSRAAAVGVPGIQVLSFYRHDRKEGPLCTVQKQENGHPEFNLTFPVLAAGIPPLPEP